MPTITVEGMSCTGCEDNVTDALAEVPGVESATADHEAGTATVEGDADVDAVVAAVEDAGYEASA
jgi:copper chaperone CopZ